MKIKIFIDDIVEHVGFIGKNVDLKLEIRNGKLVYLYPTTVEKPNKEQTFKKVI